MAIFDGEGQFLTTFLASFPMTQVLMDPRGIRDLWRAVLRCRRASTSTSKGLGESTNASGSEVSEGSSRVLDVLKEISFVEEWV